MSKGERKRVVKQELLKLKVRGSSYEVFVSAIVKLFLVQI